MANQPVLTDTTWIPWENSLYIGGKGNEGIDAALGHGPSGNQATFAVLCNWDDVNEVPASILGEHFYDATKPNLNRILPKGEILPVPVLGSVTFGAPLKLEEGETKPDFLTRTREAVLALRH